MQYRNKIRSHCFYEWNKNPFLSEEIAAETMYKFSKKYGHERLEEKTIETESLLISIAKNIIKDDHRKKIIREKVHTLILSRNCKNNYGWESRLNSSIDIGILIQAYKDGLMNLTSIESRIFEAIFIDLKVMDDNSEIVKVSGLSYKQVVNQKKTMMKKIRKFIFG